MWFFILIDFFVDLFRLTVYSLFFSIKQCDWAIEHCTFFCLYLANVALVALKLETFVCQNLQGTILLLSLLDFSEKCNGYCNCLKMIRVTFSLVLPLHRKHKKDRQWHFWMSWSRKYWVKQESKKMNRPDSVTPLTYFILTFLWCDDSGVWPESKALVMKNLDQFQQIGKEFAKMIQMQHFSATGYIPLSTCASFFFFFPL